MYMKNTTKGKIRKKQVKTINRNKAQDFTNTNTNFIICIDYVYEM